MADFCAACQEPLLVLVESDSENEGSKNTAVPESVPDDVELNCGCHFHWYACLTITEYQLSNSSQGMLPRWLHYHPMS